MATVQGKDIAALFNTLRDQRDEARAQAVTAGAEIMRLVVENGDLRDALQDWQVAAETRQSGIDTLRILLDDILNHSVANRGTKDAFFRCYTYKTGEMPEWVKRAEDAAMAALDPDTNTRSKIDEKYLTTFSGDLADE